MEEKTESVKSDLTLKLAIFQELLAAKDEEIQVAKEEVEELRSKMNNQAECIDDYTFVPVHPVCTKYPFLQILYRASDDVSVFSYPF